MLKLLPATVLAIIALATAGVFTFAEAQSPPARCGGPCQQCRVQLGVVTDAIGNLRYRPNERAWEHCITQARAGRDQRRALARR